MTVNLKIIRTKGDEILEKPIYMVGDKGIFVKEIERALLEGTIDFAVHSMKDIPGEVTPGLTFVNPPKAEDPRDVLVAEGPLPNLALLEEGIIGTGSLRRQMQLRTLLPKAITKGIRGNIETRMEKIETEDFDAVILAKAGLVRGGYTHRISYTFSVEEMIPAPCQGILGIQIRKDDEVLKELLAPIADEETTLRMETERAFQRELEAGCHSPMGVYASFDGDMVKIRGCFGVEGGELVKKEVSGPLSERVSLARQLARDLKESVS